MAPSLVTSLPAVGTSRCCRHGTLQGGRGGRTLGLQGLCTPQPLPTQSRPRVGEECSRALGLLATPLGQCPWAPVPGPVQLACPALWAAGAVNTAGERRWPPRGSAGVNALTTTPSPLATQQAPCSGVHTTAPECGAQAQGVRPEAARPAPLHRPGHGPNHTLAQALPGLVPDPGAEGVAQHRPVRHVGEATGAGGSPFPGHTGALPSEQGPANHGSPLIAVLNTAHMDTVPPCFVSVHLSSSE